MKKILVTRSSMPPLDEYLNEIKSLWDSHWLSNNGDKYRSFQLKVKEYLDCSNIELMVNGHFSLELALQAMNLTGEVITTPYTFASTTHAIVRNGLKPVFCDIDPLDFTIDPSRIENLITDKTSAILPVHVYGNICNIEKIDEIAQKYGLKVIYDAAHSFGVKYKGKRTGAFGDASCFSFHATKVFNTIEGGAVCFKDSEFGARLFDLKNFGFHGPEDVYAVGANAKMNEFCAAMGLCNLRHIDNEIQKRKAVVERYRNNLKNIPGLQLNIVQRDVESNYSYFPIVIHENEFGCTRNDVVRKLEKENIYARKYFYPLTNSFSCYRNVYNISQTPIALHLSLRVVTLPLYSDLSFDDVDKISEIVLSK